jgi:hypothetical protein
LPTAHADTNADKAALLVQKVKILTHPLQNDQNQLNKKILYPKHNISQIINRQKVG